MTSAVAAKARPIPDSHLDLLTRPVHAVLTTMGPDGQPQSSLVWVDVQDGVAVVNTTLERQKARNMVANPKVSLLVIDPGNGLLRIRLPRRAACAGDEGRLPHPCPADQPRRDPHRRPLTFRLCGRDDGWHLRTEEGPARR